MQYRPVQEHSHHLPGPSLGFAIRGGLAKFHRVAFKEGLTEASDIVSFSKLADLIMGREICCLSLGRARLLNVCTRWKGSSQSIRNERQLVYSRGEGRSYRLYHRTFRRPQVHQAERVSRNDIGQRKRANVSFRVSSPLCDDAVNSLTALLSVGS